MARFWSPKKRAAAVTLRQEGYSYGQVARKLGGGATASGVMRLCRKFETTGKVMDKKRSGRPRISTVREDRMLIRSCLTNRRKSLPELRQEWEVRASKYTVRRRLIAFGLKARIPRRKPLVNVQQRLKRLNWAKDHLNWSQDQWNKVLWSDESRITLFASDGTQFVWRRTGEAQLPACLVPTVKHPEGVMIWGCMAAAGVGRICVVEGIVNAKKYIDILIRHMLPSAGDLFLHDNSPPTAKPSFIFQQDNAPCHTAQVCSAWFRRNGIEVLDWPGNSPDLNPIENLWARLKRLVSRRQPSNKRQLIEAIIHSWHHVIQPQELQQLINSMQRRCQAVIRARGYPTKY